MEDVGQGRLDQFPAGNALDGPGQLRRQPVELVLHQHSLKGLEESEKGDIRRELQPLSSSSFMPHMAPSKAKPVGQTAAGLFPPSRAWKTSLWI